MFSISTLQHRLEWRDYDALIDEWVVVHEDVPALFVEPLVRELEREGYDRATSINVEGQS